MSPDIRPGQTKGELTPQERVKHRYAEHLRDATLNSARFLAFVDYVKLQNSYPVYYGEPLYNEGEVKSTIYHRLEKVPGYEEEFIPGYKEEYKQVLHIGIDYWDGLTKKYGVSDISSFHNRIELLTLKNQEEDKRNQQPPALPQQ